MAAPEVPDRAPRPPASRQRVRSYVKSFADHRVCAEPTCGTTLSKYNRFDRCWQHTDPARRAHL